VTETMDTAGVEAGTSPLSRSAWDRVKLARHPDRPHTLDYVRELMTDFVELHGDRTFGDDRALIGGLAKFDGMTVMVIGHQKGGNTKENLARNFGMPRPEGYRKAVRLLHHAEKFAIPVVLLIDTPAADPGIGSEERGQATAIAESLLTMADLSVPSVAVVIGEGGSGGALAISVADRILMLENAVYAVASPEACAAILWKDSARAPEAAETMRITADDLYGFGIVDEIIPELIPASERPREAIATTGQVLRRHLHEVVTAFPPGSVASIGPLREARYRKFRRIGAWSDWQPDGIATDIFDPRSV